MVIPYVRQVGKTVNGPQFMSHRNLEHLASRRFPSPLSQSSMGEGSQSGAGSVETNVSPETIKSRLFNAREEKALYGSSLMPLTSDAASEGRGEGQGDRMEGALVGAKALVVATTLVMGFTGLGMWAVGKAVGAEDVRFFFFFWGLDPD